MTSVKEGDSIAVHYKGKLADGTTFDSSSEGEPLRFTVGSGDVMAAFENGVVGMNPGEERTLQITSENAFGPHREDLIFDVERARFPADLSLEVGQHLSVGQEEGTNNIVTVKVITDETVTLDANHPLAGQDLTFDVQLVEIS